MQNVDMDTVEGFGDEWSRFDHSEPAADVARAFDDYFSEFPWSSLPPHAVGFDAGCGTGRWARLLAPHVGGLHCVDVSGRALNVARKNLAGFGNVTFHEASVASMPLPDSSMDFGYSLGVLHHMPDSLGGLQSCVRKLKPGAPFLLYLYYAFDNRPAWFRLIWRISDALRRLISRTPHPARYALSQGLAASVYWPLARSARILERMGLGVEAIPLSCYRDRSFYLMRNDALDRFGTRLEQRFTRREIQSMMERSGLTGIRFREGPPYWCAVGWKSAA